MEEEEEGRRMRKGGGGREEEVEQEATANEYSLAIPAYQSSKSALDVGGFFLIWCKFYTVKKAMANY